MFFLNFSKFPLDFVEVMFEVFWPKSKGLGRIGRSGKVLGFISSNFGPNPTAGRPPKGNNRGTIIIIIIPVKLVGRNLLSNLEPGLHFFKAYSCHFFLTLPVRRFQEHHDTWTWASVSRPEFAVKFETWRGPL